MLHLWLLPHRALDNPGAWSSLPHFERKSLSPYAGTLGQSTPSGGSVFTELNLKLTVADKGELLPHGEIPWGGVFGVCPGS